MPNILIVDDEAAIRETLRGVLEDEGYQIAVAESAEQGLEGLGRKPFDVVMLDIWLPGIDGMEVPTRIQEMPVGQRPEVVMISGHGSIESAVRATKPGAFDFLEKPLSIDKVAVVVKNAL